MSSLEPSATTEAPPNVPVQLPPPVTILIEPILDGDSIAPPIAGAQQAGGDNFNDEALQAHNKHRQCHMTPGLKWNATLEQGAQIWADTLAKSGKFQHSKQALSGKFGENIAKVPIR